MASGTITKAVGSYYRLRLAWSSTTNAAANTSTLTTKLYWETTSSNGSVSSASSKTATTIVNGNTRSESFTASLSANQSKLIQSETWTVAHNANGAKSISIGFNVNLGLTLGGTSYGTVSHEGTAKLDTIEQGADGNSYTFPNGRRPNIGETVAMTISKGESGNTFSVYLKNEMKDRTYTVDSLQHSSATSVNIPIPVSILDWYPYTSSPTMYIRVRTYDRNGNFINEVDYPTYPVIPSSYGPSIDGVTLTELVPQIRAISQNAAFLQNASRIQVAVSASAKNSAVIRTASYKIGDSVPITKYASSHIFEYPNYSANTPIEVSVTDSRGFTTSQTGTVQFIAYQRPTVKLTTRRDSEELTTVIAEHSITYQQITVGGTPINSIAATLQYSLKGSDSWTTARTISNTNGVSTIVGLSQDYDYSVRLVVTDAFGSQAIYLQNVLKVQDIFDADMDEFNINSEMTNVNGLNATSITANSMRVSGLEASSAEIGEATINRISGKAIQVKTVSVAVTSLNTAQGTVITWDEPFDNVPIVQVTAQTTLPHQTFVSISGVSRTGCTIYLTRTSSNSAVTIHITAIQT